MVCPAGSRKRHRFQHMSHRPANTMIAGLSIASPDLSALLQLSLTADDGATATGGWTSLIDSLALPGKRADPVACFGR
ncbi:hypothetical protein [Paracoccus salsus]|uniref:hypothetical protein n=1 Tax=Paracoccus salsus TaxID=2911061 RepID=UPI001F38376F|nr:hypothetical protein [Paracoccus salsus]MCF3973319.1 hypothetical protein [Paracoccus salsus]